MPPLDVEPHSSAHSSVAVPQVSSRDAGSWRQLVQRPGWSGRGEGSVGSHCVSCRKTSPSEGRGSMVWGWVGGTGPSIASGMVGLHTRKTCWLCSVPPKAQAAQKAWWHCAGVGHGSVAAQRAHGRLAGPGRRRCWGPVPPGWLQRSPQANLARLQEARPSGQDKARPGRFVVTEGSVTPAVWAASWSLASSLQFLCSRTPGAAAGPRLALLIVCCG